MTKQKPSHRKALKKATRKPKSKLEALIRKLIGR